MMRPRRMTLLLVGAGLPLSWLFASGAALAFPVTDTGQVASKTVVLGDSAEGWYAPSVINLCALPIGCPPALLQSLYPANTLHVGVLLGSQTGQTFLRPELGSLPPGAAVRHATMTLPLATAGADGTVSPDSATAIACLVTGAFVDGAAGSPATAPALNCKSSAKLRYDGSRQEFTVDITSFVAAWAKGAPEDGVAVIADPAKVGLTDDWHLAFDGRKLAGARHISTSVTFTPAPPSDTGTGVESSPSPTPTVAVVVPPQPSLPTDGTTETVEPPAPVIAPNPSSAATPLAFSHGFKYPMAYLFPIALLAVAVFLTRLFTSDATPTRRR
jgi:hypothetical protein